MDTPASDQAVGCSEYVLRLFPKPCLPRKRHRCRICGRFIEVREPCCRWTGFYEGPFTSHAHPECYDSTKDWDDGDWEGHAPGDDDRPATRMIWPQQA